jgi:hypothetical protein
MNLIFHVKPSIEPKGEDYTSIANQYPILFIKPFNWREEGEGIG